MGYPTRIQHRPINMTETKQKFIKGDLVKKVPNEFPSHFKNEDEAIIIDSYAGQFGGSNTDSYTVFIKGKGEFSWCEEKELTLIDSSRLDLLEKWRKEREERIKVLSDLDWIFEHGKDVAENTTGASIEALAKCCGINNLWGSRGEFITYRYNASMILSAARPYLLAGAKMAWIKFGNDFKSSLK